MTILAFFKVHLDDAYKTSYFYSMVQIDLATCVKGEMSQHEAFITNRSHYSKLESWLYNSKNNFFSLNAKNSNIYHFKKDPYNSFLYIMVTDNKKLTAEYEKMFLTLSALEDNFLNTPKEKWLVTDAEKEHLPAKQQKKKDKIQNAMNKSICQFNYREAKITRFSSPVPNKTSSFFSCFSCCGVEPEEDLHPYREMNKSSLT